MTHTIRSTISLAICLNILLFSYSQAHAKTYQWLDKQGVTQFTEYEPDKDQIYSGSEPDGFKARVNPNQMAEKDDYLYKRATLEEQISGTINDVRRDQLKRQLLTLDYNWYSKYDPDKAAELKQQMNAPRIRVVPKNNQSKPMDKMKAFY